MLFEERVIVLGDDVVGYLADELASTDAAADFVDGLDGDIDHQEYFHLSCAHSIGGRIAARGHRKALVDNYFPLFRVEETSEGNGVFHVRFPV